MGTEMRNSFVSWLTAAAIVFGFSIAGANAANAQSVMRTCATEWKQAQTAGTTGGEDWPQFLAQCRTRQGSAAAPSSSTAAPAPSPQSGSLFPWSQPSAPTSTAASNAGAPAGGQSVMRLCASQWKEAKTAGTTAGQTWPQFLTQCRRRQTSTASSSGGFAPAPSPAPAPASASQSGSLFPWWQQSAPSSAPASNVAPSALQAGQYTTELAARARCPSETVVWVNTPTRIYHYSGTRYYGHTLKGAYMCEADARGAGYRAARNRQREAEAH
jgi:hypothetical protein